MCKQGFVWERNKELKNILTNEQFAPCELLVTCPHIS